MIVFCDTSALMKLYVREAHSDWTDGQVRSASRCLVSQITWAEMCAALAFKQRSQQIDGEAMAFAVARLRAEWNGFVRLAVDAPLITDAGALAQRHALRAYDSVQLASARKAQELAGAALHFCCFDKALNQAAMALGITTLTPPSET